MTTQAPPSAAKPKKLRHNPLKARATRHFPATSVPDSHQRHSGHGHTSQSYVENRTKCLQDVPAKILVLNNPRNLLPHIIAIDQHHAFHAAFNLPLQHR